MKRISVFTSTAITLGTNNVKAIIDAVKELNTIYAVAVKTEGGGVLEDILQAVRGVNND